MHNIGEERNVGMVNYESSIRGKNQLKTVSSKLVINKSYDLLSHTFPSKYKTRSEKIKELGLEWTEKIKDLYDRLICRSSLCKKHMPFNVK